MSERPPFSAREIFHITNTPGNAQVTNVGGNYHDVSNIQQITHEQQKEVYRWLSAPDSSSNYHAAREEHHADTGTWFIEGESFVKWKETPDSALWVYGTPGCGKTIICSTVIDDILNYCAGKSTHACAYFFFDNKSGQSDLSTHSKFIRSIIRQLSYQYGGVPASLMEIYRDGHQQPSIASLQLTLRRIIEEFEHVYIVVDALDECTDRKKVLAWIAEFMQWHGGKLHILVSSRPETDIKKKFHSMENLVQFSLTGHPMNNDIEICIDALLLEMDIWDDETRAHVRAVLIRGAHGMFQWIALQIVELSKCRTRRSVDDQLKAVPKGLDAAYERMLLSNRNPGHLKQLLIWLAFSQHDLRVEELADVIAVDFSKDLPSFDPSLRFFRATDVLEICCGFVTEDADTGFITLDQSVKDYLVSDRIKGGAASSFGIDETLAQKVIAQTCLAYVLHLGTFPSIYGSVVQAFPLAAYAARHWITHMRLSRVDDGRVSRMTDRLFSLKDNALINWVRLDDPDQHPSNRDESHAKAFVDIAAPLYYASSHGLEEMVKRLLGGGANVRAPGGKYGNALQAASYHGHDGVVDSLLDYRAYVPAQGGEYDSALIAASREGHTGVVQLLLRYGVNANVQGVKYGSPLQAAAYGGEVKTVRLLINYNANVHAQGGAYGNALQAASFMGHVEVVQLLLDRDANVNAQGGQFGNALKAASYAGHESIVRLLLEKGANVNAVGEPYDTALSAACAGCHAKIVQLLVLKRADMQEQGTRALRIARRAKIGSRIGHAHHEISQEDRDATVHLLLDGGAIAEDEAEEDNEDTGRVTIEEVEE
ncbi:ankyrin [Athelia psychrophila]|uniref:Ankyrin n=1 Tax=Athelia psychrophila TaxID=1759441 RepID=A0A167XQL9_9AGAM|nr:ankyrin [Fibularhizoctonia sp. CBS 109695]